MLHNLLTNPPVNQIIVFEDSITAFDHEEDILTRYCAANDRTKTNIINEFNRLKSDDIVKSLQIINKTILPFIESSAGKRQLLEDGISTFAKENGSDISHQIEIFSRGLEETKEIFKKYGIADYSVDYEKLLSEVIYWSSVTVTIYDSANPAVLNSIIDQLSVFKCDFSNWTLLFVDKKLSTGDVGLDIARPILKDCLDKFIPITSVVYTSTANPQKATKEPLDQFVIEVKKSTTNEFELISDSLLKSAFTFVYNYIKEQYKYAIDQTFDLILGNSDNIFNLVTESHNEGTSSIEAIFANFNLTHNFNLDKILYKNPNNYLGLSVGFQKQFYNPDGLSGFSKDLKTLNCFEIFDYRINEKLLPVDNGDVFKINGNYFILVGQSCDLSVRKKTNSRKIRNAELISATFIDETSTRKFEFSVTANNRKIEIGFFKDENGRFGKLNIEINQIKYCDFPILDLCTFNQKGESFLKIADSKIEQDIKKYIPHRIEYYNKLKTKLSGLSGTKFSESLLPTANDFSVWNFEQVSDDTLKWDVKRICRIKGDFAKAMYNEYISHRQRFGLNNILPVAVTSTRFKIFIDYILNTDKHEEYINVKESNGKMFIHREELLSILKEKKFNIVPYFNGLPENIEISNGTKFFKFNLENNKLILTLPYYSLTTKQFYLSPKLTSKELNIDGDEFYDSVGNRMNKNKLRLSEFKNGIIVKDTKKIIKLDGGIISVTNGEQL